MAFLYPSRELPGIRHAPSLKSRAYWDQMQRLQQTLPDRTRIQCLGNPLDSLSPYSFTLV